MRQPDHRRLADAGQRVDLVLDLFRIDVEASRNDKVLGASDDTHASVRCHGREIAGDEVAVGAEVLLGLFGIAPVSGKHVRPTHLQHARLAKRHALAFGASDPDRDAGQREANGPGDARAIFVGVGGDHAGLGHAVALNDLKTGARLEGDMRLGEQRRRARNHQTQ